MKTKSSSKTKQNKTQTQKEKQKKKNNLVWSSLKYTKFAHLVSGYRDSPEWITWKTININNGLYWHYFRCFAAILVGMWNFICVINNWSFTQAPIYRLIYDFRFFSSPCVCVCAHEEYMDKHLTWIMCKFCRTTHTVSLVNWQLFVQWAIVFSNESSLFVTGQHVCEEKYGFSDEIGRFCSKKCYFTLREVILHRKMMIYIERCYFTSKDDDFHQMMLFYVERYYYKTKRAILHQKVIFYNERKSLTSSMAIPVGISHNKKSRFII